MSPNLGILTIITLREKFPVDYHGIVLSKSEHSTCQNCLTLSHFLSSSHLYLLRHVPLLLHSHSFFHVHERFGMYEMDGADVLYGSLILDCACVAGGL